MSAMAKDDGFLTANPHALATILQASETRHIIASRDVFDVSGVKLWARDQPVSKALQRRLLDRQLRDPLETCLMSEDGVTPASLVESLQSLWSTARRRWPPCCARTPPGCCRKRRACRCTRSPSCC
jgi:hypothetical protein